MHRHYGLMSHNSELVFQQRPTTLVQILRCVYLLKTRAMKQAGLNSNSTRPSVVSSRAGRRTARVVTAKAVPGTHSVEVEAFRELVRQSKLESKVDICCTPNGHGLAALRDCRKGEVLLSVPRSLSIVLDYNCGLEISEGKWPRLQEGASMEGDDPLPWDLLMALALMDALAGEGSQLWGTWAQAVLPPPEALCLPMCWGEQRLAALQHDAIAEGARQQQARLRRLFPTLCDPTGPDSCSWLAWAFACVRSRAFRLGDDVFAYVPFMDVANHAPNPNAAFRMDDPSGTIQLIAVDDVSRGGEVTISYTGPGGMTNQRFMAQYGFVPNGNPSDRLVFDLPEEMSPVPGGLPVGGLDLSRFQDRLGDTLFSDAVSARNPYLHAALKSFPMAQDQDSQDQQQQQQARQHAQQQEEQQEKVKEEVQQKEEVKAAAGAGKSGDAPPNEAPGVAAAAASTQPPPASLMSDMELAQSLKAQCQAMLDVLPTSLEDDEEQLEQLQKQQGVDPRDLSALKYRMERKRLIQACLTLLGIYLRQGEV